MRTEIATSYDSLADEYARRLGNELEQKPFDQAFLRRFESMCPEGALLEVGCGPGHVGEYVRSLGRAVAGIDISTAMVAIARARAPVARFEVADMRALPFPDACFAGVIAFYAIVHFTSVELSAVLAELRRVLVPGGCLALAFHCGDETRRVTDMWGVPVTLDFVFQDPARVATAVREAGLELMLETQRPPYPAPIEAQTERCYMLCARTTTTT